MEEEPRRRGRPKGSTDKAPRGGRKLTAEDVILIRDLADEGVPYEVIQEKFPDVRRQTISQIVLRKTWKNVA